MYDKKAIALLKKYYLPHKPDGEPSDADMKSGISSPRTWAPPKPSLLSKIYNTLSSHWAKRSAERS